LNLVEVDPYVWRGLFMVSSPLSLLYFPTAIALGALHAVEPGHAKTLTAAYLIGIKGTKRDAVVLGLSVAATHSVVVVLISLVGLWLGREAFADEAAKGLQLGSGIVVILLGGWLMWRRWPRRVAHGHTHSPEAVSFGGELAAGRLQIVGTPEGERLQCQLAAPVPGFQAEVEIARAGGVVERLRLVEVAERPGTYMSSVAPAEPHEFAAKVMLQTGGRGESLAFEMHEPEHHHDHADMDEEAHARAHAATMPDYVQGGQRPTLGQIMAFGAAGGMIPCPASVTVMLLALSIGETALGVLMVVGFSLGLALTLVGMGLVVVLSLGRLSHSPRFERFSRKAPLISAGVVVLSGLAALLVAMY
jgi:nickel/cobalt transporter (NicO) family protein